MWCTSFLKTVLSPYHRVEILLGTRFPSLSVVELLQVMAFTKEIAAKFLIKEQQNLSYVGASRGMLRVHACAERAGRVPQYKVMQILSRKRSYCCLCLLLLGLGLFLKLENEMAQHAAWLNQQPSIREAVISRITSCRGGAGAHPYKNASIRVSRSGQVGRCCASLECACSIWNPYFRYMPGLCLVHTTYM